MELQGQWHYSILPFFRGRKKRWTKNKCLPPSPQTTPPASAPSCDDSMATGRRRSSAISVRRAALSDRSLRGKHEVMNQSAVVPQWIRKNNSFMTHALKQIFSSQALSGPMPCKCTLWKAFSFSPLNAAHQTFSPWVSGAAVTGDYTPSSRGNIVRLLVKQEWRCLALWLAQSWKSLSDGVSVFQFSGHESKPWISISSSFIQSWPVLFLHQPSFPHLATANIRSLAVCNSCSLSLCVCARGYAWLWKNGTTTSTTIGKLHVH